MLEALEPHELVEMRAAYDVVPLEDGWRQAGTIAAAAHNDHVAYCAMKAGRRTIDPTRLRRPDDYIARVKLAPGLVSAVDQPSIDAHQAALERRYGVEQ